MYEPAQSVGGSEILDDDLIVLKGDSEAFFNEDSRFDREEFRISGF